MHSVLSRGEAISYYNTDFSLISRTFSCGVDGLSRFFEFQIFVTFWRQYMRVVPSAGSVAGCFENGSLAFLSEIAM